MERDLMVIRGLSLWRWSTINRGGVLVLRQRIHLGSEPTPAECIPSALLQRDDEDSVGAEEFSALRQPGYEWVNPRVKLPLSRFSKAADVVAFRKKYDIIADTIDERIEYLSTLSYLDQLPKKLSSKKIIGVFRSSHPRDDLFKVFLELRRKKLEEEKRKGGESYRRFPAEMSSQKSDLMPPTVEKKKSIEVSLSSEEADIVSAMCPKTVLYALNEFHARAMVMGRHLDTMLSQLPKTSKLTAEIENLQRELAEANNRRQEVMS
ncbi:hypothetical protein DEO72_LG6g1662 [Vigna unguiculata]|uniref:Uncharacterized protein n=1 Tax=Vigna unguiculata TaxID=3917 RepID=A0A4D6M6L2_VIGUN|nr:hypothetical protein DEO72_LG6g1662 [Vigna unguiculata]